MATGTQVTAYFQRVMDEQLLPSGRVVHRPMSRFVDGKLYRLVIEWRRNAVDHSPRKVVDATRFSPRVPATEAPPSKS